MEKPATGASSDVGGKSVVGITNSSNSSVTNTYASSGTYNVSLIVTGAGGASTNTYTAYIVVKPNPMLGKPVLSGGSLILSGTNGPAGVQYRILTSTNVALALTNWTPVLTNVFAPNGSYGYTNSATTNSDGFFILVSP
jgi:PKD repeat protein